MLPALAAHGEPARAVRTRMQAALNGFADVDIFILHVLAHSNTVCVQLLAGLADIAEIEIELDKTLVRRQRKHEVRIHYAYVDIDHEVGIEPVVVGAVAGTG